MAKTQGILPIYDPATKRILGAFTLAYSKTFTGDEVAHNIDPPNASTSANTVPVQKIMPDYQPVNKDRKEVDWFMAAVFPDAVIRSGGYKNYKNFAPIEDMAPSVEWVGAASHSMGQLRYEKGSLLRGIESGFSTGAPNLKPVNTVAPTITGTMTAGQTLSINQGTWTEDAGRTVTYQWKKNGANVATTATYVVPAGSVGHLVSCEVTHTFGGESTTVVTLERTITA
jgi:hypothetical protein